MTQIRYMQTEDREFWYTLDRHLPRAEFANKVRDKRGYGSILISAIKTAAVL